jgi:hypothetical protein
MMCPAIDNPTSCEIHDDICETLKHLCRAIQNKRGGLLTSDIVLRHDNACPRTAARTRALLENLNWEIFNALLTALILLLVNNTCLPT